MSIVRKLLISLPGNNSSLHSRAQHICAQKSVPHSSTPRSALNEVYTHFTVMYVYNLGGGAGGRSSSTAPFSSTRLILVGSECPRRRP